MEGKTAMALRAGPVEWLAYKTQQGNLEFTNEAMNSFMLEGFDLSGLKFSSCTFERGNLKGANLQGAIFKSTNLNHTELEGADARKATFIKCAMDEANVTRVDFSGATLTDITLQKPLNDCRFVGSQLKTLTIGSLGIERCNFDLAKIQGMKVGGGTIRNTTFIKCEANELDLRGCTLEDADFGDAKLHATIFADATAKAPRPDVPTINFRLTHLANCRFENATMHLANFQSARIDAMQVAGLKADAADFSAARITNLTGPMVGKAVNFSGAELWSCPLDNMKLPSANFKGAKLFGTHFSGGDLSNSIFTDAQLAHIKFTGTNLDGCDLRWVGLVNCELHRATVKGTKITRLDFEDMQVHSYYGLLKSQMYDMAIEDGFEQIRRFFGGFYAWYHAAATLLWLFPLVLLVVKAIILSAVPEYVKSEFFVQVGIGHQIWGYIESGDASPSKAAAPPYWEYHWSWLFFLTFAYMFAYNVARLVLVLDVKIQEHALAIKALYPKVEIGFWRKWLSFGTKWGSIFYGLIAIGHIIHFVLTPYPVMRH